MSKEITKLDNFLSNYDTLTTIKSYKWTLGTFIKAMYGKRTDTAKQFEQYFSEKRDHEQDILDFQKYLNGSAPLTVRQMNSSIRTFFEENNIEFPKKFWKKISKRRKTSCAISIDEIPDEEQLRQIFTHMSTKGKAFYLVLASSGMRFGELLKLELDDVDLTKVPTQILIQGKYTKTGRPRHAFISSEATEVLKEWLKIHEASIVTLTKRSSKKRRQSINRNRLFPFEACTAREMWNVALRKSKLDKKDKTTNRFVFHPHVLRKFFRTQMATVIPVDVTEALIGHEGYLTEVYRKHTPKSLAKLYLQGEHTILVFRNTGDLDKIKKEFEEKKSELTDNNITFQKWFIQVKQENVELKNKFDDVKKELTVVKNFQKKLEDEGKDLKAQLKSAIEMVYSFEAILNTFSAIADTVKGQELIKKIHEAKMNQETFEAQEEDNKDRAEITEENPISKT